MTSRLHSHGQQLITKENIVTHTIILILSYRLHTVAFHLLNFLEEVNRPSLVDIISQQPQVSAVLKGLICNGPPIFKPEAPHLYTEVQLLKWLL